MTLRLFILMVVMISGQRLAAESSVWEITSGNRVLVVGGSITFLNEQDMPLPPEFEYAYRHADEMVFEANALDFSAPRIQARLMQRMMLKDQILPELVEQETYLLMAAACRKFGVPEGMFDPMHPAMAMENLSAIQLGRIGYPNDFGLPQYLDDLARREKKPVSGLDPVETHLRYLSGIGKGYEDSYVRYRLHQMKVAEEQAPLVRAAWKEGDRAQLVSLLIHHLHDDHPEVYDALIKNRNDEWLLVLKRLMNSSEKEFVLMPVENLLGPHGLLNQMETAGYSVAPLKLPERNP